MRNTRDLLSGALRLYRREHTLLLLLLVLAACGGPPPAPAPATVTPTSAPTRTATALPTGTATATPQPSRTATPAPPPLTHYAFVVHYDAAAQSAQVAQTLRYANTTQTTLQELPLVVEANRRQGVFTLTALRRENGEPIHSAALDGALLSVPLPAPLAPGETVELRLHYTLQLPDRPGTLGYNARQANFGEWYPFVPAYLPPGGWQVYPPSGAGEHLVYDTASFEVEIRPANAPPGLLIAASAEARQVGNIFRYQRDAARNFAWSASDRYTVVEDAAGETTVRGYVFPEHAGAGLAAARYVREALEVYSGLLSPYQPAVLTFVEAGFDDGMEYDGLFFLDDNYFAYPGEGPDSGLAALSAHETAHQWWFARVGSLQPTQPWLDEALCVYSEALYYEALYPDLLAWWWGYRVDSFALQGHVNSTIYDLPAYRPYVNAVYLRGARFLRDLRAQLGDEAFFTLLRAYDAAYANKVATAGDFFALAGDADLDNLLAQYFRP